MRRPQGGLEVPGGFWASLGILLCILPLLANKCAQRPTTRARARRDHTVLLGSGPASRSAQSSVLFADGEQYTRRLASFYWEGSWVVFKVDLIVRTFPAVIYETVVLKTE